MPRSKLSPAQRKARALLYAQINREQRANEPRHGEAEVIRTDRVKCGSGYRVLRKGAAEGD